MLVLGPHHMVLTKERPACQAFGFTWYVQWNPSYPESQTYLLGFSRFKLLSPIGWKAPEGSTIQAEQQQKFRETPAAESFGEEGAVGGEVLRARLLEAEPLVAGNAGDCWR